MKWREIVIMNNKPNVSNIKRKKIIESLLYGSIPFVVIIIIWSIVSVYKIVPGYVLPTPLMVLKDGFQMLKEGILLRNILDSLLRLFIGVIVGVVFAIPLGILIGLNKYISDVISPLIKFFQSISGLTWVPLAVLWFGFGWGSIIFVIANMVFFIMVFNIITGIITIPQVQINAIRTLGCSKKDLVIDVLIPGAFPNIVTGLRTAIGFGWRAVIAAEMIAASTGLGYMIWDARAYFEGSKILLGAFSIGVTWLIIDALVLKRIEIKTIERWGMVSKTS